MLCKKCVRSPVIREGQKCNICASVMQKKLVSEFAQKPVESGDRPCYEWRCAACQKSTSTIPGQAPTNYRVSLIKVIKSFNEKFELVNKIQLPKLSNDLMQVKSMTEQILQQNESLLRKISELDKLKKKNHKKNVTNDGRQKCRGSSGLRMRNLNLMYCKLQENKSKERDNDNPPSNEKHRARYRTRRPYILYEMFQSLNRKQNQKNYTPRKRIYTF